MGGDERSWGGSPKFILFLLFLFLGFGALGLRWIWGCDLLDFCRSSVQVQLICLLRFFECFPQRLIIVCYRVFATPGGVRSFAWVSSWTLFSLSGGPVFLHRLSFLRWTVARLFIFKDDGIALRTYSKLEMKYPKVPNKNPTIPKKKSKSKVKSPKVKSNIAKKGPPPPMTFFVSRMMDF